MVPWSSGTDAALSMQKPGFNSRWHRKLSGCGSMVDHLAWDQGYAGSIPVAQTTKHRALAQSAEHSLDKREVVGAEPTRPTKAQALDRALPTDLDRMGNCPGLLSREAATESNVCGPRLCRHFLWGRTRIDGDTQTQECESRRPTAS